MRVAKPHNERSEEHTSELQSHSEISYAVFCLKKKKKNQAAVTNANYGFDQNSNPIAGSSPNAQAVAQDDDAALLAKLVFFFNDTATPEIYTNLNTLSLHDALPI